MLIEIPLDKGSHVLTFPALIALDGVNSLDWVVSMLAEWARHSLGTPVVATDPTSSGSNRAGTSLAACFPDILAPGTHESLFRQFLLFFLFLTQDVVPPCFFFL